MVAGLVDIQDICDEWRMEDKKKRERKKKEKEKKRGEKKDKYIELVKTSKITFCLGAAKGQEAVAFRVGSHLLPL